MFKKTLFVAAVVVSFSTMAAVAHAEESSGYVFGSLGQSDANVSGASDTEDTAWKLGGGLQLSDNWGVELQYTDLGQVEGDVWVGGVPFQAEAETQGFGANLVGTLPFERFQLFGKLGYHRMETEIRASGFGVSASDDATEWVMSYGIGAAYELTANLDILAEYEMYSDVADEYDVDMLSAGLRYNF
ncbi:porin family protein [Halopseudomonas salina]|uniref:Outer membrane protein beta-barrel domain-containing protein n=1 Tax=Halopseudomonas salina TaxID=1323744 RepID=A0ABQ1PYB7_9GAMM|nr:porin family protein [Halopseudomonas salina]GGD07204.1 hypothetical protein GCM10007418_27750 [Halopseudomonas salina]